MSTILFCKKCLKTDNITNFINKTLCISCFESSSTTKKKCKECKVNKQMLDFYKNASFKDGRFNTCIECVNLKNRKGNIKSIIPDSNFYDDFIKEKIIKTSNEEDKIIATDLFKEYKKFLKLKNYKCNIFQETFKNDMMTSEFLGEQLGNCWKEYKIIK